MRHELLLTFYGDDFTGSTTVTEVLALSGIPAVLITDPAYLPRARELFPQARAIGLAGVSRSMTRAQLDAELPTVFRGLAALGAPLFHYKICSTFDSAPDLGSIGRAVELGLEKFQPPVPVMVGTPVLGRYQVFGNLFATAAGTTYRLDRHPTMSAHPATPMGESDLRLHLARQTDLPSGLVDLLDVVKGAGGIRAGIDREVRAGNDLVFLDVLSDEQLEQIGEVLWSMASGRTAEPLFTVGASGIEDALVAHWRAAGRLPAATPAAGFGPAGPVVVVSGSASPATSAQIAWAEANGFATCRLDGAALVDPALQELERQRAVEAATQSLAGGTSVVLYTVSGNRDPALRRTRDHLRALGGEAHQVGELLGVQLGHIMRDLLESTPSLRRVCVAGGDTCGHVVGQLGVHALEVVAPVATGSPLCLAHSAVLPQERLEISLKAGQVGGSDYFGLVRDGVAVAA